MFMALKTDVEEVAKNTVKLKVEVPENEIQPTIKKAYKDIANKVRIPGFRKGKAPKPIIDMMVGKEAVLYEAAQELVVQFYPQAVEKAGLEPVTTPEINIEQIEEGKPLIFTAKVEVKPEVTLGDYKNLVIEPVDATVTQKDVEKEINRLREKFATLETTTKKAAAGDYVLIDCVGYIDGKPFEGGSASDYMIELGTKTLWPEVEEQLIGSKAGEEKQAKVTFGEDYPQFAGKEAVFEIKIKEVKTKKLPPADDELAQTVSKFDTLKELKADIEQKLKKKKEAQAEAAKKSAAVDKLVEISEVELPKGMTERRIDQMLADFERQIKAYQNITLDEWVQKIGLKKEQVRENYRQEAIKSLKTELVLDAVIKKEKLDVTEEEINKEIERLASISKKKPEDVKAEILKVEGLDYLKSRLTAAKAVDFLVSKAKVKKAKTEAKESKETKDKEKNLKERGLNK